MKGYISSTLILLLYYCCFFKHYVWGSQADYHLLQAAEKGDIGAVVEQLNEKGASVRAKNNNGVSALIFAANGGHVELVQLLLDSYGADMNDRSNDWKTPFLCATRWCHLPVMRMLAERGADVTIHDREGMNAVMLAVASGNKECVEYALQLRGVNVTRRNIYNGTALSLAHSKGLVEVEQLLEPFFEHERELSPYVVLYGLILEGIENLFVSALQLCKVSWVWFQSTWVHDYLAGHVLLIFTRQVCPTSTASYINNHKLPALECVLSWLEWVAYHPLVVAVDLFEWVDAKWHDHYVSASQWCSSRYVCWSTVGQATFGANSEF